MRLAQTTLEAKAATLVVRYASASEAERQHILAWVSERPEHAVAFARAEAVWRDAALLKSPDCNLRSKESPIAASDQQDPSEFVLIAQPG